jgi:hypothetical protein
MDDLLDSAETAAILGIKINTLEIWRIRGNGPAYVKMGDHARAPVRYRRTDVVAWIEQRLRISTSAHSAALAAAQRPRAVVETPIIQPWLQSRA